MSTNNLEEAAKYLKTSSDTVRDMADVGTIPGAKVGKAWVFRTSDLDAYLGEVIARQTEERREAMKLGCRKHIKTEASEVREKKSKRTIHADLSRYQVAA